MSSRCKLTNKRTGGLASNLLSKPIYTTSLAPLYIRLHLGDTSLSIRGHLAEHEHGVEEHLDGAQLQLVVHLGHHDALDVDGPAVRLDCDLFPFAATRLLSATPLHGNQNKVNLITEKKEKKTYLFNPV